MLFRMTNKPLNLSLELMPFNIGIIPQSINKRVCNPKQLSFHETRKFKMIIYNVILNHLSFICITQTSNFLQNKYF